MARVTDDLADLLDRVAALLSQAGRTFASAVPDVEEPFWINATDHESVLSLIRDFATDPDWIFLSDAIACTEDAINAAQESIDEDDSQGLAAIKSARAHLGHIGLLYVHIVHRKELRHAIISYTADWYAALPVADSIDDDEGGGSLWGSSSLDTPHETLDPAELKRLARSVAADKVFQDAAQPMQQQITAAILGETVNRYDISPIATEAARIWVYEIKPAQNAELKPRALALLKQGMKRALIAAELGIPERRLREIV